MGGLEWGKRKSGRPSFLRSWGLQALDAPRRSSSLRLGPPTVLVHFPFSEYALLKRGCAPCFGWGSSKRFAVVRGVRNWWTCWVFRGGARLEASRCDCSFLVDRERSTLRCRNKGATDSLALASLDIGINRRSIVDNLSEACPEALEAPARYMVILLTAGFMPFQEITSKFALILQPIQDLRAHPRQTGYPFQSLETGKVLLVRTFSLCSFSCFNPLLRGLVCVCCTT